MVFRLISRRSTGWRDVTENLRNGWTAAYVHICRIDHDVFLRASGLDGREATSGGALQLPTGFGIPRMQVPITVANGLAIGQMSGSILLSLDADARARVPNTYAVEYSQWAVPGYRMPTTIPGIEVP